MQLAGDRIAWIGPWASAAPAAGEAVTDLGESVLLPGLINAHCHLDYTDLAGRLPPPRRFIDWIQRLIALKAAWTPGDYARSWRRGADMLLRHGTTTVADVEAVPELLPAAWEATPLRVLSFRELIAVKSASDAASLVDAAERESLRLPRSTGRVGLSPHAPYTTSRELLEFALVAARRRQWRLVTHVAESTEEFDMFKYRHGPMFDWLKDQRDPSDCGFGSPVHHLERCGYLDERLLAVHANCLDRHDPGLLARRGVSVVHCPGSHDYFRHLRFPFEELAGAGVNLCLGTDSLASARASREQPAELNLFTEMRAFAAKYPEVSPDTILAMTTRHAARALGFEGRLGELAPGALADFIAVPHSGPAKSAVEAVVQHRGPVAASMIAGAWALPPAV